MLESTGKGDIYSLTNPPLYSYQHYVMGYILYVSFFVKVIFVQNISKRYFRLCNESLYQKQKGLCNESWPKKRRLCNE